MQEIEQGGGGVGGTKQQTNNQTRTRRRERQTKEPARRLQEKLASIFKTTVTEDEKKADLKESQAVEGICDRGAKRLE